MFYPQNYGVYAELVKSKRVTIDVNSITIDNWYQHFNSVLNIMRDGIETEYMYEAFITVVFSPGVQIELTCIDYWYNLIMWYLIIKTNNKIEPRHIFFDEAVTRKTIKNYIDRLFIQENRTKYENIVLNNMIDDCIDNFNFIDEFAFFLANTVNLEDFIKLMNEYPEFNQIIHADLSNIPLEDVKAIGMQYTDKAISYIKNSDHCLSNFFMAGEGVNKKQFKEFAINIGTKPDGRGGAFPTVVNTNFITGGVNDILSYLIESSTGRIAQIIVEGNVGPSGYFARLLGLNSTDTFINTDPNYSCNTKNFQKIFIKDDKVLYKFENRYYRLNPNGVEYKITHKSTELIGQYIYLRSPMTCASAAAGTGICYKCYGDLAHTNKDISIGKIAAESLSAVFTQMMLSAKHLLESAIKSMNWREEEQFKNIFEVDYNIIKLRDDEDISFKNFYMLIDPTSINLDNEEAEEDSIECEYNEYITSFDILYPNGNITNFGTTDVDNIYLTPELTDIIRSESRMFEGKIKIDLTDVAEYSLPLFALKIHNNDMSQTLDKVKTLFDNVKVTTSKSKEELLQTLIDILIETNLNVMSVHTEVLLMNQIRSLDNVLEFPQWQYPDEPYTILTLKQSLQKHPSVAISLSFEKISRLLYNPLTFKKTKPSYMDLFFMQKPQEYLSKSVELDNTNSVTSDAPDKLIRPIVIDKDINEILTAQSVDAIETIEEVED